MDTDLLAAYAATVLEITLADGSVIVVEPRPPGTTSGRFPEGHGTIHVVTAANPYSRRMTDEQNAERNRRLRRDLRTLELRSTPAIGRSPDGDWAEESFAIYDTTATVALGLARAHEQHALFRWTPDALGVIGADGQELAIHGWQIVDRRGGSSLSRGSPAGR